MREEEASPTSLREEDSAEVKDWGGGRREHTYILQSIVGERKQFKHN